MIEVLIRQYKRALCESSFYIVQHVIVDDYCKSERTPWLD